MKVRVVNQPSGLLSLEGAIGTPWPEAGELVDLPDFMAEDMIKSGHVEKPRAEKPKAETRPAPKKDVEERGGEPTPKSARDYVAEGAGMRPPAEKKPAAKKPAAKKSAAKK